MVEISAAVESREKTFNMALQDANRTFAKACAAIRTLEFYGFNYDGDTYWKPPVEGDTLTA